ncbi:methyltransferase domain-containing protein [Poseidonocella sp. HB161398]|uniref:methyltransferase domain-containing protein n=1 Tax=Poseidonocella sp. HB161398 TaxID=2320855 RepID=UPI00198169E4|nr:methyltransferase domain-containing protein [Poseidonocella sp. HB161398]
MVHFAPEPELTGLLRSRAASYRTADIAPGGTDPQRDLEAIALPHASAQTVMANHALEHVDDSKALRELLRILRPGGHAILTMPVIDAVESSYEVTGLRGAPAQFRHFGHEDHVRAFGRDIASRITAAGFPLELIVADGARAAPYPPERGDTIYLATRPA